MGTNINIKQSKPTSHLRRPGPAYRFAPPIQVVWSTACVGHVCSLLMDIVFFLWRLYLQQIQSSEHNSHLYTLKITDRIASRGLQNQSSLLIRGLGRFDSGFWSETDIFNNGVESGCGGYGCKLLRGTERAGLWRRLEDFFRVWSILENMAWPASWPSYTRLWSWRSWVNTNIVHHNHIPTNTLRVIFSWQEDILYTINHIFFTQITSTQIALCCLC